MQCLLVLNVFALQCITRSKKSLLMAKQKGQFAIANHDKATQHKEPMKTPRKRM